MKTPVCDMCRLTPIKCILCEKKYKKGELTQADFDVSRAMSRTKTDLELEKAFNLGNCYAIISKGKPSPEVEKELGKKIIKIKTGKDILNKLKLEVRPSKVFVNGEERTKIAINRDELKSRKINVNGLKKALTYFKFKASIV